MDTTRILGFATFVTVPILTASNAPVSLPVPYALLGLPRLYAIPALSDITKLQRTRLHALFAPKPITNVSNVQVQVSAHSAPSVMQCQLVPIVPLDTRVQVALIAPMDSTVILVASAQDVLTL